MISRTLKLALWAALLTMLHACDTVDCTLNNKVACTYNFYSEGAMVQLNDKLTVTACGTDSVLINAENNAKNMVLPMSYWNEADTLVLQVMSATYVLTDTLYVRKSNTSHFESPDCPTTMFHEILSVDCTHSFIDSVTVVKPSVNYDELENIQIHLHSGN